MAFALVVLVLAAGWRIFTLYVPALSNFSPVMALAFCAGAYFRRGWTWLAPFAALVVSDLYIDHYYAVTYHYEWTATGAVVLAWAASRRQHDRPRRSSSHRRRNWLKLYLRRRARRLGAFFTW